MKKYGLKIAGFFLGFCLVLALVCLPFQPLRKLGNQYIDIVHKTQNIACEKEDSIDALILGDSIAWAGISPLRIYAKDKITTYNGATSGQRLMDSIAVLERTLRYQSLKTVVLETNCIFTEFNSMQYSLEKLLPIFRYHDYYLKDFEKGGSVDDWKGYNYTTSTYPLEKTDYMAQTDVELSDVNQALLEQLYAMCTENGISLVLMTLPCPNSWNGTKHDLTQAWADAHSVPFLDMNTDAMPDMDFSTDFRDYGEHLNDSGAAKCSYVLGDYIKDNYSVRKIQNADYEKAIKAIEVYGTDGLQ